MHNVSRSEGVIIEAWHVHWIIVSHVSGLAPDCVGLDRVWIGLENAMVALDFKTGGTADGAWNGDPDYRTGGRSNPNGRSDGIA